MCYMYLRFMGLCGGGAACEGVYVGLVSSVGGGECVCGFVRYLWSVGDRCQV